MATSISDIQIADRGVYRRSLAAFIQKVTDVPKVVLPYMPAVTKLQSPMMSVTGAPTDRKRMTSKSYENSFAFGLRLITLYSKDGEEWTPEQAEDMLDRLEREASIALLLADMQSAAQKWLSVSRQGASTFDMLKDSGAYWLTETIPVILEVDDAKE